MRKKILDAALLFAFALCLIVTSNIQEEAAYVAELENEAVPLQNQEAEPEEMQFSAGVAAAISANSFTTESDEKTGVEKKDVVLVTTSNDSESNLEEETDGSVETNTEVSESGQVEEVSGTSQAPAYNNRWNISLTDEEIDLLAKIVWLEANGEPVEGQEAVVEVVLNRMASDLYPDTLYDVLSQNNPVQFVSWKRRDKAHPTPSFFRFFAISRCFCAAPMASPSLRPSACPCAKLSRPRSFSICSNVIYFFLHSPELNFLTRASIIRVSSEA